MFFAPMKGILVNTVWFLSVNSPELFFFIFVPLAAGLWVCMNRVMVVDRVRVKDRVTVSTTRLKIIWVN